MDTSEQINELATALAQAQSQFKPVKKSGKNPHLKSEYATLDDVLKATSKALSSNGLALVQSLDEDDKLTTALLHNSGQWISSTCAIPATNGHRGINQLQAFGGALTYMRRYALTALLGVSSDTDDDAHAAKDERRQPKRNGKAERPLEPDVLRRVLHKKVADRGESGEMPATEKQAPFVASKFTEALSDQSAPTEAYHLALGWLWGVDSAKKLSLAQAKATLDWLLEPGGPNDTGDTPLHEHAPEESRRVLRAALKEQGQQDMFEE